MNLSKNRIKYIHSLELKKIRKQEKVFLAEGHKLVEELLGRFKCRFLVATSEWLTQNNPSVYVEEIHEVSEEELAKASLQKSPQQVLAVFEKPNDYYDKELFNNSLCLALDDVQDPGNLGTILRIADWFGIEHIFCSPNTVDVYSPKAIQATMGAIARVQVHYTPLMELITSLNNIPIYGTFLDGENIYSQSLSNNGIIIMGNEGNGISREIEKLVDRKLFIPNYPKERSTSESLNVAIATAITCAEFRRKAAFD